MGLLDSLVRAFTKFVCGNDQQQQQQQQLHPAPHAPESQFPGSYAEHSRPPQQHQQPAHSKPQQHQQHQPHQQQQHQQQHQPQQQHGAPTSTSPRPGGGARVDLNQQNQHDAHYVDLRARANAAGDAMARSFDAGHGAYASGDGARAKALSEEGKRAKAEMERLNGEAAEWIFRKNNEDSGPREVDLHGLYVKEAIFYTDRSIQEARNRGDSEIHLIVGKGLHSRGGVAKLKPAIEELIQKHNLVAALDPHNAGVLIVHLDGRGGGAERSVGADDITRKLERDEEQCVIM